MNVLDRRASGAREDRCKIGALCWCKSSHQIYPIENPGGFVYSAALPRARFFREECRAAFILLTKGGGIDSHFLEMLGQARKLYTTMPL